MSNLGPCNVCAQLNRFRQIKYYADASKTQMLGLIECSTVLKVANGKKETEMQLVTHSRTWLLSAENKDARVCQLLSVHRGWRSTVCFSLNGRN